MTKNKPKLYGYSARDKNTMVLLYRRNRKVTFLFQLNYNRTSAETILGARFYGRMFPQRCDLSPNGKYFIYFAMGKSNTSGDWQRSCWTAICQPPRITADIFLEQYDTWGGGGTFLDDNTVYVSYGASPQYDVSREMYFDDLTVTFDPRRKEEAYEKDRWFNIERTSKRSLAWQKENWGIFLQRRCRKWDRNQSIEFDLFHYTLLVLDRSYELEYQGILAQWADFDNVGRLVCGHGNLIIVYDNLKQAMSQTPKSVINLDNFID